MTRKRWPERAQNSLVGQHSTLRLNTLARSTPEFSLTAPAFGPYQFFELKFV